jgi:uncharacterized protein (TIGR00297 family)
MQILYGFILAIIVAFVAYRSHSLNNSGAFAATLVGTIIFGLGGLPWAILLLLFFITSSKGHERDAGQVFGNGGLATLFVLVHALYPESMIGWLGFAASLAAVNADTWATELGVLNPTPPRMITDLGKRVEKGTSGGVSLFGTLASLLGSAIIALPAILLSPTGTLNTYYFLLITAAGLAGSLFDSFLGATVQAMYFCPGDQKETEKHPLHTCGTQTVHIRGWEWLDNDWVNFSCSALGALIVLIGGWFL